MEPRFIDSDRLQLVGFSFYGDPFRRSPGWTEENEIGRLWSRFMTYATEHQAQLAPILRAPGIAYEVHIYNDETQVTGEFEVFVGAELTDAPWRRWRRWSNCCRR
jgi:hypothetical protein